MKTIYKLILTAILVVFVSKGNLTACDKSSFTLLSQVDNGNGTVTYNFDITVDIGGLDATYYGFVIQFTSAYNTPTVVSSSPTNLATSNLYSGSLSGTLTGLKGANVNSVAVDSDWNKYDNLTNVISFENGSFGGVATNDFSFLLSVTVSGCVENIMFDSHVNSGASSCRYNAPTGKNCACQAAINPSTTPDTICQVASGNVDLEGNVTGTLGASPTYNWSSSNPIVNSLIASPSSENTNIPLPAGFAAGNYPITFTYTDANTCNLSYNATFTVGEVGEGSCEDPCDFYSNENVIITPGGNHNATAGYTQIYVLTDLDSVIIATSTTGNFGNRPTGSYLAFALNYDDVDAPSPLPAAGVDLSAIIGSGCMDVSPRLTIGVCEPCTDPAAQPTNIVLSNQTHSGFQIAWTESVTSTNVIVVVRETSSANSAPVDGNTYVGNTVFGLGDNLGNNNFVVYSGITGFSPITVTGLEINTSYTVSIYAANDDCILIPSPLTGTTSTLACTPPTTPSALTINPITVNTATLNWVNGSGNRTLIVIRESTTPSASPVDGTTYNGNLNFGSGDSLAVGNYVVYAGTTITSATITGLTINTSYVVNIYSYSSTGICYSDSVPNSFTTPEEVILTTDTVSLCGGKLYDAGGPSGNYPNGATLVLTLLPDNPGDVVCLHFLSWDVDFARVKFFDGMSINDPLIDDVFSDDTPDDVFPFSTGYGWTQTDASAPLFKGPGNVCSKLGPLTMQFDPSGTDVGFEADVICYTPQNSNLCEVTASASTLTVCNGESVDLSAIGAIQSSVLKNDFNNRTLGSGWTTTVDTNFSNPCYGTYDGSRYLWMGIDAAPRALTSQAFDVSNGGYISFAFMQADDDDFAPCEGPDREQESVYLQYSTDGTTWVTFRVLYEGWTTLGTAQSNVGNWVVYNLAIPLAAQTASTQFRWYQYVVTSNSTDHWGLDEILISTPKTTSISWDNGLGAGANHTVTPTSSTTYTATITDGSTSCNASVSINVCSPLSVVDNTFYGSCSGDVVELIWKGSYADFESNYIIEKAEDGLNFEDIGTVKKTYGSDVYYSFNDFSAINSSYYRIKVKNYYNESVYSSIVGPLGHCKLSPNCISNSIYTEENNTITLNYSIETDSPLKLDIFDLAGRLIFEKHLILSSDNKSVQITLNKPLSNAMYMLNASTNNEVFHQKIYINK